MTPKRTNTHLRANTRTDIFPATTPLSQCIDIIDAQQIPLSGYRQVTQTHPISQRLLTPYASPTRSLTPFRGTADVPSAHSAYATHPSAAEAVFHHSQRHLMRIPAQKETRRAPSRTNPSPSGLRETPFQLLRTCSVRANQGNLFNRHLT